MSESGRTDRDILRGLARHLRKHDVGCFDDESNEQERAEQLVDWLADNVDVLNTPEWVRGAE